MSDIKPFKHGEEGTHSVCNKHNIGGKSVCCECSGKTDCSNITSLNKNCIPSGQYSKDDSDQLHFYCENCGKEMKPDEERECQKKKCDCTELHICGKCAGEVMNQPYSSATPKNSEWERIRNFVSADIQAVMDIGAEEQGEYDYTSKLADTFVWHFKALLQERSKEEVERVRKAAEEMIKTQDGYLVSNPDDQYRQGMKSGCVFILSVLSEQLNQK